MMSAPSRDRPKHEPSKPFWLDKMPALVREKIAVLVSDGGQLSDDALCLALTSQLQRLAVMSFIPSDLSIELSRYCLSHGWVNLLVGHIRSVSICNYMNPSTYRRDDERGAFISPLLRLLRKAKVERASVPGIDIFLCALKRSESLRHLAITGGFSHTSLIRNLHHIGPSLSSLHLTCDEKYFQQWDMGSPTCPIECFHAQGWIDVTTSCPNLKHLHLSCRHIEPDTVSLLVHKLPSLASIGVGSPALCRLLDVSEEDIVTLCSLEDVSLENVSGGLELASRIGKSITGFVYTCRPEDKLDDEFDLAQELVKYPRLSSLGLKLSRAELYTLITVIPQLRKLTSLTIVLEWGLFFEEIRDTVIRAIKILRIHRHPEAHVNLRCTVSQFETEDIDERLLRICSIAADEGGKFTYAEDLSDSYSDVNSIECKITLVRK